MNLRLRIFLVVILLGLLWPYRGHIPARLRSLKPNERPAVTVHDQETVGKKEVTLLATRKEKARSENVVPEPGVNQAAQSPVEVVSQHTDADHLVELADEDTYRAALLDWPFTKQRFTLKEMRIRERALLLAYEELEIGVTTTNDLAKMLGKPTSISRYVVVSPRFIDCIAIPWSAVVSNASDVSLVYSSFPSTTASYIGSPEFHMIEIELDPSGKVLEKRWTTPGIIN